MLKQETSLKNLVIVYFLWLAAGTFSGSMMYLYFKNAGVAESDLVISFFFSVISAILIVLAFNRRIKTDLRTLMSAGIFIYALSFIPLFLLPPAKELLFIYCSVVGVNFFFFWSSFNILYFEISQKSAALFGFIYFSSASVLGITVPVFSGFIAENYGFNLLFFISAVLYVLLIPCIYLLGKRECSYDIGASFREMKGLKTLIFIQGIHGGGVLAALSIIPLFYFKTPVEMGVYLSLTTVFSVIASALISHLSDKIRRRKLYIRVFGAGLGLASIISSFSSNAINWSISVSFRNFFSTLFLPFTTAIISDNKQKMENVMVGREIIINAGRILGIAIVLICSILLSNIHLSLLFLGLIIMSYPFIIELKRKHITVS